MLPQSRTLEGGNHAGERQSAEGSRRCRKAGAGCRHSRGEMGRNAHEARKGGLKGVELGSFRVGSQEKTADAVLGEAGAAAVGTWAGAGASAGAIHHPAARS